MKNTFYSKEQDMPGTERGTDIIPAYLDVDVGKIIADAAASNGDYELAEIVQNYEVWMRARKLRDGSLGAIEFYGEVAVKLNEEETHQLGRLEAESNLDEVNEVRDQ